MVTKILFTLFVLVLIGQRLYELRLSARNERQILAKGGLELGAGHFGTMKALHSLWFASMLAEMWLLDRPFVPGLALAAGAVFLLGQVLRYLAIRTLKDRWTVKILILPGAPPVQGGVYRYLRHPNYVGVVLELLAAPLIHSAYLTAIVFSLANLWLLVVRIRAEERALTEYNQYGESMADRPRFIPVGRRRSG